MQEGRLATVEGEKGAVTGMRCSIWAFVLNKYFQAKYGPALYVAVRLSISKQKLTIYLGSSVSFIGPSISSTQVLKIAWYSEVVLVVLK